MLAAKENSNHLFSQGSGIFGGHSEIAGNINDRYPADLTFTELHDTLDFGEQSNPRLKKSYGSCCAGAAH